MKRALLAGVAALAIVGTSQAWAQQVIELAPEQRVKIKEYVVREKVKPIVVKERLAVGATVPTEVELAPVPSDWGPPFARYRYIYSDNHVVLVEPSSRRVIQIID